MISAILPRVTNKEHLRNRPTLCHLSLKLPTSRALPLRLGKWYTSVASLCFLCPHVCDAAADDEDKNNKIGESNESGGRKRAKKEMRGGRFTRAARQRRHESQWDLRPVCWLGAETPQRRPHSFLIKIDNFKAALPPPCQTGGGMTAQANGRWGWKEGARECTVSDCDTKGWGGIAPAAVGLVGTAGYASLLCWRYVICSSKVQRMLFPPLFSVGFARQTACVA